MSRSHPSRSGRIIRWIARVWTVLFLLLMVVDLSRSQLMATGILNRHDLVMLSFQAVAFLGLLLAFRWELAGGITAVAAMILRDITFYIVFKVWTFAFLLGWVFIITPAVLFILAWWLDRQARVSSAFWQL